MSKQELRWIIGLVSIASILFVSALIYSRQPSRSNETATSNLESARNSQLDGESMRIASPAPSLASTNKSDQTFPETTSESTGVELESTSAEPLSFEEVAPTFIKNEADEIVARQAFEKMRDSLIRLVPNSTPIEISTVTDCIRSVSQDNVLEFYANGKRAVINLRNFDRTDDVSSVNVNVFSSKSDSVLHFDITKEFYIRITYGKALMTLRFRENRYEVTSNKGFLLEDEPKFVDLSERYRKFIFGIN